MAESSIPNATVTSTSSLIQFNPAAQLPIKLSGSMNFTTWKAQFELFCLAILMALRRHHQPTQKKTTKSLRDHLGRLAKDTKTASDYFREIRTIADVLTIAGSPLSNAELVVKKFFTSITAAVTQRTSYPGNFTSNQRRYQQSNYQSGPWCNNQTRHLNSNWRSQAPPSNKVDNRPRCQLCDKPGHIAKVCRSQLHNHMVAKAHFASRIEQPAAP
ncbi:uncharacterized protein LOC141673854 [Apium graveolens]|uniref:uncharacterized protein LOC141673854 n=1 Tax=Apium graveolens TaxID=4045 RepID=UPI003D7C0725